MKNPVCPRCDSTMFDGEYCIKCGHMVVEEPEIPEVNNKPKVSEHVQEIRDKWAREYGLLKSSPKRIAQKRNFDKWCQGEQVA